jgi:two-component system, NarL family, response regulator DesR
MIAEDNEDLRATVVALLSCESDFRCVAETDDLQQVGPMAAAASPDVIILDIELKGQSSLPRLAQLRHELPGSSFVIYSGHALPDFVKAALAAGAREYVLKSGDPDELVNAVRRCANG